MPPKLPHPPHPPHVPQPQGVLPPPTVTPTLNPPELDHPSPIPKFHPLNPVLNPGTHTTRGTYTGAQYTGVVYRRTTYTGACTTLGHHGVRHTGGQYTEGQYVGAHHTTGDRDHHDTLQDGRYTRTLGRHQVHHPSHALQLLHGPYPLHHGEHHRAELHSPTPTAACAAVTAEPYTTSSWAQVSARDWCAQPSPDHDAGAYAPPGSGQAASARFRCEQPTTAARPAAATNVLAVIMDFSRCPLRRVLECVRPRGVPGFSRSVPDFPVSRMRDHAAACEPVRNPRERGVGVQWGRACRGC